MNLKRRQIDLAELAKYCEENKLEFTQDEEGIRTEIVGPCDTVFWNRRFGVLISFTPAYPFSSPSVGFLPNTVWHPNVDFESGSVCLNLLNEKWVPSLTLQHIIEILLPQLLADPNPDSPLNIEAARQLKSSKADFEKAVEEHFTESPKKKSKHTDE
jgi:ubiquitin-protein ligase